MRLGPGSVQGAGGSEGQTVLGRANSHHTKKSQKLLCIYAIPLQSIKCSSHHDENAGSLLRSPRRELLSSKGKKWVWIPCLPFGYWRKVRERCWEVTTTDVVQEVCSGLEGGGGFYGRVHGDGCWLWSTPVDSREPLWDLCAWCVWTVLSQGCPVGLEGRSIREMEAS